MIEIDMYKRDTYYHQLERVLDLDTLEECQSFNKRVIECMHRRVLDRQKNGTIYDSNNATEDRKKWVQNLSSTPLTKDQESQLSHGPTFVITPKQ